MPENQFECSTASVEKVRLYDSTLLGPRTISKSTNSNIQMMTLFLPVCDVNRAYCIVNYHSGETDIFFGVMSARVKQKEDEESNIKG